ncbi:MAG: hypothetical protein GTO81_34045 [Candidatus Aminicenantes bacterium]|nr:hypothetical protein [Candidatus Aminicenantes bacterium]
MGFGFWRKNISSTVKNTEENPDIKKEKAVPDFSQRHVQKHDDGSQEEKWGYSRKEGMKKR